MPRGPRNVSKIAYYVETAKFQVGDAVAALQEADCKLDQALRIAKDIDDKRTGTDDPTVKRARRKNG